MSINPILNRKNALISNLAMKGTDLAFTEVGDYGLEQLKDFNFDCSDGSLNKILLHSLVGGGVSAITDNDILSGILSAGLREGLSPLTANSEDRMKLLVSQLIGITAGGLVDGDKGANNGYIIATSGELYNRQLHQKEVEFINNKVDKFATDNGISKEKAKELLTLAGNMLVDETAFNEYNNSTHYIGVDFLPKDVEKAMNYLLENSKSLVFLDEPTQREQNFFSTNDYTKKNSDYDPNQKGWYYFPNEVTQQMDNEMIANQIRGKTNEEVSKLFVSRIQSDISKAFVGLGNSLDKLYNLDTSNMSPKQRLMFDYLNLKVVTVPGVSETRFNQVDRSKDILINEIEKDMQNTNNIGEK